MPAYKAARTIEKTYREIPEESYDKVLVDLRQEFVERENALGL